MTPYEMSLDVSVLIPNGAVVVVIVRKLDLQVPVQSMTITTNVVSLNPVHGEVCSIQHYVIKFVIDLRQVDGFLWVPRFLPPIKLTATNKTEILLSIYPPQKKQKKQKQ